MWAFITGPLAGPIFGSALVLSLIGGAVVWAEGSWKIASLEHDKAKLEASISDPKTGFAVRNAQCETNIAQLSGALTRSNQSIGDWQARAAAATARAAKAIDAARASTRAASDQATRILALQPSGDVCKAALDLVRNAKP